MLNRGTLLLLVSAITLTGGVLLFENRSGSQSTDTTDGADAQSSEKLFPIDEEDIESFVVIREASQSSDGFSDSSVDSSSNNSQAEELSFTKNDDGTWQMAEPKDAIAESGAIAFLLSQLTSPTARPVSLKTEDSTGNDSTESMEEFGLADPDYSVSFTAKGNDYLLHVGGLDFAGDKRYVQALSAQPSQLDTNTDQDTDQEIPPVAADIYAVPGSILNAVNRPTQEWLVADETSEPAAATEEATTEDLSAEDASEDKTP